MTEIDDAAEAALRVYARCPDLSLDVLAVAAEGALEAGAGPDLEVVIERIAREFAGLADRCA